jgi:hypothetical protein
MRWLLGRQAALTGGMESWGFVDIVRKRGGVYNNIDKVTRQILQHEIEGQKKVTMQKRGKVCGRSGGGFKIDTTEVWATLDGGVRRYSAAPYVQAATTCNSHDSKNRPKNVVLAVAGRQIECSTGHNESKGPPLSGHHGCSSTWYLAERPWL